MGKHLAPLLAEPLCKDCGHHNDLGWETAWELQVLLTKT